MWSVRLLLQVQPSHVPVLQRGCANFLELWGSQPAWIQLSQPLLMLQQPGQDHHTGFPPALRAQQQAELGHGQQALGYLWASGSA